MSMIEFCHVFFSYPNKVEALKDINFFIGDGEFVFLTGSTGAGKSTILKLIYRELLPSSGEIYIDNNDITDFPRSRVPYLRRMMGIVFQDFKLLEYKTVWENVSYALEVTGCPPQNIPEKVESALQMVGLLDKKDRLPDELSGGEKQLTSIARALVHDPKIFLADEPTGNLDPEASWNIVNILDSINSRGTTVIVATHDESIVKQIKKRVIVLEKGEIKSDEGVSLEIPELKI